MAVINGRESNLTQIDPNRYLNNVKLAKEALELAQLLRGLDRQVSVVTEGEKHSDGKCNRMETFFNYKPEPFTGSPLKDGIKYGGIEIKYSQKAFSSDYTANDALALNWASTTGNVGFLIHRYEYNYTTSYKKTAKIVTNLIMAMLHMVLKLYTTLEMMIFFQIHLLLQKPVQQ